MKIGIDLGNTIARAAYLNEQGIPQVVPDFDDPSVQVTPSLIHIGERGCLVGESVELLLENEPNLPVARDFKAHLSDSKTCYTDEHGRNYEAVHLTALLLRKLVQDAEKAASEIVEGAVFAVPRWFDETDKAKITEASEIAGIGSIAFHDESISIAHHYGLSRANRKQRVFIYDMGTSTFTATLIEAGEGKLEVIDSIHLDRGAGELDEKIVELCRKNFQFAHGTDPMEDAIAAVQLRHFAQEVKTALSGAEKSVRKSVLLSGKPLEIYLDREQLRDLFEETLEATAEAIKKIVKDTSGIDRVLMSGGNCGLDVIREFLSKKLDLPLDSISSQQPDFAEAFGAAHLTKELKINKQETSERSLKISASAQVLGKDLVVRSLVPGSREEIEHLIIRRDSPLPARRELRCATAKDGQEAIEFDWALSDETGSSTLGKSSFTNLSGVAKGYPIDLTVIANLDGSFDVIFTDPSTGRKHAETFEYSERREMSDRERLRERLRGMAIN